MSASRHRLLWLAAISGVIALLGAARLLSARPLTLPVLASVPAFQLSDERGAQLGRDQLLGHVTVVDFIFTSCSTACPLLSTALAHLQDDIRTRGLGTKARLLSISVDPERDTSERLRAFAARYGADPHLWHFARGAEGELRRVVIDGMKQHFERQLDRGELDGFTILHGTRFVLIDDNAQIRGFYDARDPGDMAHLREAITALVEGRTAVGTSDAQP